MVVLDYPSHKYNGCHLSAMYSPCYHSLPLSSLLSLPFSLTVAFPFVGQLSSLGGVLGFRQVIVPDRLQPQHEQLYARYDVRLDGSARFAAPSKKSVLHT